MSSQKIKPPKICKCGHKRIDHLKNPNARLKIAKNCNLCPCDSFMNRIHPTRGDKISAVVMPIIFIAFASSILILWTLGSGTMLIESQNQTVPLVDFLSIVFFVILLGLVLLSGPLIADPIELYFKMKRRPDYPIHE